MAAYSKHTWTTQDPITKEKLNAIETGISNSEGTFYKKVVITLSFSWNSVTNTFRYTYTDSDYVANMRPIIEIHKQEDYQYVLSDIIWQADASDHTITFSTKFDPGSIKGSAIYATALYFLNVRGTGNTSEEGVIPAVTRLHTGQNLIQQITTPKYSSMYSDSYNATNKGTIVYSNDYDALLVTNSSTNTRFYLLQSWPVLNGEVNNNTPFCFSVDFITSSGSPDPHFVVVFTDTSNVQSTKSITSNNKFRHKDHATGGDYIWTTYYGSCIAGEDIKSIDICFVTGNSGSTYSHSYYIKNFKVEYGYEPTGYQIPITQVLTKAEATDVYLTKTDASSTYQAAGSYLTTTAASSTYLTQTSAASTYLKRVDGAADSTSQNSSGGGSLILYRFGRVVYVKINGTFSFSSGKLDTVISSAEYRPSSQSVFLIKIPTGGATSTSYVDGKITFDTNGEITIRDLNDSVLNQPRIDVMKPNCFTYIGQTST